MITRRNRITNVTRGTKAAVVLAAGMLGAGMVGAPAATAAPVAPAKSAVCTGDHDFGIGCFDPDGDHIIVEDYESDGWRIEVQWETDYGRSGVCAIQTGKDFRDCNYNMAENHFIYFEVHAFNDKFGLHDVLGAAEAQI